MNKNILREDYEKEKLNLHRHRCLEFNNKIIKQTFDNNLIKTFQDFTDNILLSKEEQEGARLFLKYILDN